MSKISESKYSEPHEGTVDLVEKAINSTMLGTSGLNFKVLVDNKQTKKPVKVVKANDLVLHETGNHVYIFVNEIILDELYNVDNNYPNITILEALCAIKYDIEKGVVSTNPEDLRTYKGVIRKFGLDTYERVDESIQTLYQVEKDKQKN